VKPVALTDVTSLLTGVAGLDLWQRDDGRSGGDRAAARAALLASADAVAGWYERFAASLNPGSRVPEPVAQDQIGSGRLVEAVRRDLRGDDGGAGATAVRIIWTGDHLDAARRLQDGLVGPARAVTERARGPFEGVLPRRGHVVAA
jgi:hypothetical protein